MTFGRVTARKTKPRFGFKIAKIPDVCGRHTRMFCDVIRARELALPNGGARHTDTTRPRNIPLAMTMKNDGHTQSSANNYHCHFCMSMLYANKTPVSLSRWPCLLHLFILNYSRKLKTLITVQVRNVVPGVVVCRIHIQSWVGWLGWDKKMYRKRLPLAPLQAGHVNRAGLAKPARFIKWACFLVTNGHPGGRLPYKKDGGTVSESRLMG